MIYINRKGYCSGLVLFFYLFLGFSSSQAQEKKYKTKNVVILVIDGPRYTETWGDSTHQNIPHFKNDLLKEGVFLNNFRNDGFTYTTSGHTAITTGNKEQLVNHASENKDLPKHPSIFQYWRKHHNKPQDAAWLITSKDKLEILANTDNRTWKDQYLPNTDCGVNGYGTGYREDKATVDSIYSKLNKHHPELVLINFKEPDNSGHANDWKGYLKGIKDTDEYVWKLWNHLQSDPFYKDQTTLIVTNDHGRHLDSVKDGFVSHGCKCWGCRHISLFAIGPDFKKNFISDKKYSQIDIPVTVAELLNFPFRKTKGSVMKELFE